MKKITIIGAGAFGFAIADIVSRNHPDEKFFLFDVVSEHIEHIKNTGTHPIFHEGTKLSKHAHATTDLEKSIVDADLIILAVPSKFVRNALKEIKKYITKDCVFLNVAKGLEMGTNKRVSQIIEEEISGVSFNYHVACLSGGMIAREVTLKNPLAAEIGCADLDVAENIAKMLRNAYLRIEVTDDLIGIELSGALKNVIAIGAGMFDGLGYSESSKSAFVSAASKEFQNLAVALGAKKDTFETGGYAWLGDLMTTCFGKSRNREFGERIGRGGAPSEMLKEMINEKKSVEGYITTEVLYELSKKHNVNSTLLNSVYDVLYSGKKPSQFVKTFIGHEKLQE